MHFVNLIVYVENTFFINRFDCMVKFTKSNSKPDWICLLKVIVTGQYFSDLYKAIREQINFDTFFDGSIFAQRRM